MNRPRLTYGNVVATLALFIALGGASYAAVKLEKNSVSSKQIKNGGVKTKDLGTDAATGAKVDESSLGTVPFATNAQQFGGVGQNGYVRYDAPIPSGVTVRGGFGDTASSASNIFHNVTFPAEAPVPLTGTDINFGNQGFAAVGDADSSCTGSESNPTAPAGKVCIYAQQAPAGANNSWTGESIGDGKLGFGIRSGGSVAKVAWGTWAYTAP